MKERVKFIGTWEPNRRYGEQAKLFLKAEQKVNDWLAQAPANWQLVGCSPVFRTGTLYGVMVTYKVPSE